MDAGLSFQPGSVSGGTPSSALTPLQGAVQVLSLNLPSAAARNFSPLAAGGPAARGFNPEALVAQTLLKSLSGVGIPNQTLVDHLTSMLSGVGQSAPSPSSPSTLAPTITPGSTGQPSSPPIGIGQGPQFSRPMGGAPTAPTMPSMMLGGRVA